MAGVVETSMDGYVGGEHTYFANGTPIRCPVCGSTNFEPGKALLNTGGMTFLKLDWLDRRAHLLTCRNCSHILWFREKPEQA
jgi:predicted nucleic-acid-binding Zn-ribbon protein